MGLQKSSVHEEFWGGHGLTKKTVQYESRRTRWLSNIDYNTCMYIYITYFLSSDDTKCVVIRKFQLCWQLVNSVIPAGKIRETSCLVLVLTASLVSGEEKVFVVQVVRSFFFFRGSFACNNSHCFFLKSQPTSDFFEDDWTAFEGQKFFFWICMEVFF